MCNDTFVAYLDEVGYGHILDEVDGLIDEFHGIGGWTPAVQPPPPVPSLPPLACDELTQPARVDLLWASPRCLPSQAAARRPRDLVDDWSEALVDLGYDTGSRIIGTG